MTDSVCGCNRSSVQNSQLACGLPQTFQKSGQYEKLCMSDIHASAPMSSELRPSLFHGDMLWCGKMNVYMHHTPLGRCRDLLETTAPILKHI